MFFVQDLTDILLQFIAVLPTTNDQIYGTKHTQRQCRWVKTDVQVLSHLSEEKLTILLVAMFRW